MTTRQVALDLSLRNNFQAIPFLSSNLDPAVDTKPQPILPKVVWALNVVATEQGVRSPNWAQETIVPINFPTNLSTPLFRQVEVLDIHGNISYMLLDDTPGPTGERIYYLLDASKQWARFVSDTYNQELYFPVKHTMFQTRTIVLWTAGDSLGAGWTPVNYTLERAFIEFDLVNKTAIFHPLINPVWGSNWIGVSSWGNYMVVYTLDRVYYSSPLNFRDFTPAEGLGGSFKISEALGPIQIVVPCSQGLMIYCRKNIVFAQYSGDPIAPFILTEVAGSGGLMLFKGEPLVTRNEQSPFQVAMTSEGLMFVSPQQCSLAPPDLQALVSMEYVEVLEPNSAKIRRHFYAESDNTIYRYTKVKRLELFGSKLFILLGELAPSAGAENFNRLMCYDLQTEKVTWVEGDIVSVVPNLNLTKQISADRAFQNKINTIVNSYVLTKRVVLAGQPVYRNIILDFVNGTSTANTPQGIYKFRQAEIMFSDLNLRRGQQTELYAVKFVGRISAADVDYPEDLATLLKVEVYSELDNYAQATQFVWEPASKEFVGYAVGAKLRVIVRGDFFDLQEVIFDLAAGATHG